VKKIKFLKVEKMIRFSKAEVNEEKSIEEMTSREIKPITECPSGEGFKTFRHLRGIDL